MSKNDFGFYGSGLDGYVHYKQSVDRINQSAPMRKHEVKSSKKYEERQLGSPVNSLRVVSFIMIGLAIIFVILLLK